MPALPRRCPVLGEGALGALKESTYRLYNCRRCGLQVRICRRCDHGNIYCSGECSRIRRRESVRRAGARYQRTRRGAARHAARQWCWRTRAQQIVTHHGCEASARAGSVSECPISQSEPTDAHRTESILASLDRSERLARCAFCGARLPAWTRPRLWPWSG